MSMASDCRVISSSHREPSGKEFLDQDDLKGPARIVIQAEVVSTYLTPLLEGLALFAEFDALPGESPVSSTLSLVTLRLFVGADYLSHIKNGKYVDGFKLLRDFLTDHRATAEFALRKSMPSTQPITED